MHILRGNVPHAIYNWLEPDLDVILPVILLVLMIFFKN